MFLSILQSARWGEDLCGALIVQEDPDQTIFNGYQHRRNPSINVRDLPVLDSQAFKIAVIKDLSESTE